MNPKPRSRSNRVYVSQEERNRIAREAFERLTRPMSPEEIPDDVEELLFLIQHELKYVNLKVVGRIE